MNSYRSFLEYIIHAYNSQLHVQHTNPLRSSIHEREINDGQYQRRYECSIIIDNKIVVTAMQYYDEKEPMHKVKELCIMGLISELFSKGLTSYILSSKVMRHYSNTLK